MNHVPGDEVTIAYTAEAAMVRERREIDVTVTEVTGQILYAATDCDGVSLVLDPEGDLWARDEDGRDGLFGSNAAVEN